MRRDAGLKRGTLRSPETPAQFRDGKEFETGERYGMITSRGAQAGMPIKAAPSRE